MTWAEFRLRQFAFRRTEKQSWYKVREIAYSALVGSHLAAKDVPRSKEKFMSLDDKKSIETTSKQLEAMRKAAEVYRKQVSNG